MIAQWKQLIFETAVPDFLSSVRYQGFVRERSAESIWRNLIREYRWVYLQMNDQLRKLFRPFFQYSELRTLFIYLRHLKEKNPSRAGELLDISLLSDEIKQVLTGGPDISAAIAGIERIFSGLSEQFRGLTKMFETDGLRAVEQKVTNTYLAVIQNAPLHPVIRTFFARVIDSRNIISMYKYMRLEQGTLPHFIPGGSIPESQFRAVIAKEDLFGVCSLVREFSGLKIDTPDPTKVEIALYKGITNFLKKEGREPFGVGPILDYLWRCSLEVMNLSVLISGKDLEREAVTAEIVQ